MATMGFAGSMRRGAGIVVLGSPARGGVVTAFDSVARRHLTTTTTTTTTTTPRILESNPHIYIHHAPSSTSSPFRSPITLSLLPTAPPTPHLSIGTTTSLPVTPRSFTPNPGFLAILNDVLRRHACLDPDLISQARAFASSSVATGTSSFSPSSSASSPSSTRPRRNSTRHNTKVDRHGNPTAPRGGETGAGGASSSGHFNGGHGGAAAGGHGRGGWVHLSDRRNPPDYGRIAWPEDILGSLEVDGRGEFVVSDGRREGNVEGAEKVDGQSREDDGQRGMQDAAGQGRGNWSASGTYRIVTNEGILGLSDYLRERVVEKLKVLEGARGG